ncbi:hypothetical protein ACFXJ8_14005 [Nonomuraea sp. NPDC059194]|uniref:hypothetical protein n=1 Tax=Nonomuraea sp. NPDC059194 TaxID=3346764 RepID=UPI003679311C
MSDTGRRERAMMTIAALAGTLMLAFSAILIGGSLPSPGPWRAQGEAEPPSPAERPAAHSVTSTPRSTGQPSGRPEGAVPLATRDNRPRAHASPPPTSPPLSSPFSEPSRTPGLVPPATPRDNADISAASRPSAPGLIEATSSTPEPPRRTKKPKRPKKALRHDTELKDVTHSDHERGGGF